MDMRAIPVKQGEYNLKDSPSFRDNFDWDDIKKNFSWNETGKVNMAYEALDRHAEDPDKKNKTALIYTNGDYEKTYTFSELRTLSNQFANVLKKYEVEKGDAVFLFMPRCPELYITFFGVLKTGAIAGPLFEAFMEQALRDRLQDSEARVLVTTKELLPRVPTDDLPHLREVIVIGGTGTDTIHYESEMAQASDKFAIEWVDLEDGLVLHYTSGSTGKPKGVYHVHHAMIQHYATAEWVLDLKEDDVYWCTAHPGWVTGTSYGIFAPWLHGITNVVHGDRFSPETWYSILERYQVTIWYTAPTALRQLISHGDGIVKAYDLSKLRHILSVGEALNPEVITWVLRVFGVRVHDTWWMTETGAQMIVNFPCHDIRPGSMGKPIPGIEAAIIDNYGNELPPNQMGNLAIKKGWPSMMRNIWKKPLEYEGYFMDEWYLSGDSAYQDEDGYFWFQGRLDDVINTSSERIGPFEVESKLLEHPAVAGAGVVGKPDPVQGEIVKAFVTLKPDVKETDELMKEMSEFVRTSLSVHAAPKEIEVTDSIPMTRSGKIMRRLLKSWETAAPSSDTSTSEN
jgi:acetyl-CoA synthetase